VTKHARKRGWKRTLKAPHLNSVSIGKRKKGPLGRNEGGISGSLKKDFWFASSQLGLTAELDLYDASVKIQVII
jgi:hypothetical protein